MNSKYQEYRIGFRPLSIMLWSLLTVVLVGIAVSYGQSDQPAPPGPNVTLPRPPIDEESPIDPAQLADLSPVPRRAPGPSLAMNMLLAEPDDSRLFMLVSLREEFSDNFDQENNNPQRESRTTLTIGTRYRATGKGRYFSLANTLDANYQASERLLNVGFANLALDMGYDFRRVSISLNDTFVRNDNLEEASSSGTSRQRTTFWRNSFAPRIQFELNRLTTFELAYTNIFVEAEEGNQDDSITDRIRASLQTQFTRTVKGGFSYSFTREDVADSDPAFEFTMAANASYDLTRNLSLLVTGSWSYSDREPADTDSLRYGGDMGVRYSLTPNLSLVLGAGASLFDDEEGDPELVFTWQAALSGVLEIVPGTRLRLRSRQQIENTQGEVENVGIVRRLTFQARLEQDISRDLRLELFANTAFTESLEQGGRDDDDDRKEFFWSTGVDLLYQLTRTWSLALQYQHRQRDANRVEDEFSENRVLFSVTAGFSAL